MHVVVGTDEGMVREQALKLWDAVETLALTSGLAELKRSLRAAPNFD